MPQAIGNAIITAALTLGVGGLLPAGSAFAIGMTTLTTIGMAASGGTRPVPLRLLKEAHHG